MSKQDITDMLRVEREHIDGILDATRTLALMHGDATYPILIGMLTATRGILTNMILFLQAYMEESR